jgi:glycosyltransferase involved in cell wall biosynthesis
MSTDPSGSFEVAVAIPCWNEAATIAQVVSDFRRALPSAAVHVFDNGSTDGSAAIARDAGATVHRVRKQGKGHVVRAILDGIEADAVIIVDGDATYPAENVHELLAPLVRGDADMVVGERISESPEALRTLHRVGNRVIVWLINLMFRTSYHDVLSGYRALDRRFIESVPILTSGFEIEAEMTVRALEEGMVVLEVPIPYRARPVGSESKLRSFRDGYRILLTSAVLLRDHYPLRVFGGIGLILLLVALIAAFLRLTGGPLASTPLLSNVIVLCAPLGLFSLGIGLTLNTVTTRFREMSQIARRSRRNG